MSKIIDKYLESALQSAANEIAAKKLESIIWQITYRLRNVSGYKKIKSRAERKAFQSLVAYLHVVKNELK